MPAHKFFQRGDAPLVDSPNGRMWWHSMPLPDGTRISGYHADKAVQLKMWDALELDDLTGKRVLDIGAPTASCWRPRSWEPHPSRPSARRTGHVATQHHARGAALGRKLAIETGDFRTHPLPVPFRRILFLGGPYHVEDVFGWDGGACANCWRRAA